MQPEHLGPYRIVRTLGRGGMGAVYEGIHIETDEPAAVKVLSPALSQEPDFRQRFEAEIETLKRLFHPNIVQLFGFGEQDEQLFYAMEMVDGCSLEDEVRQGRVFPWREVVRIGIDTCRALRHAHDRGITHRDIKPANLLLTREGRRIKLSDFGIAKLYGNSRLTATGNVLGTAEYMPPEQADARPTGPRSDLYSLGCVFYFLLTRRPPYVARSLVEMLQKHRTEQPEPISQIVSDVPSEMEALIGQLLEKDPDKRPANATLVARRLESMLKALSSRPKPMKRAAAEDDPEFDLSTPGSLPQSSPPADLPETRLIEAAAAPSAVPTGVTRPAEDLPETMETSAFQIYEPSGTLGKTERGSTVRFTVVEKEELDRPEFEPPPPPAIISLHTWILAACLIALGLGLWYFLRPPSADALYDKIVATTADRSIDAYLQAERNMQEFLTRFSSDSRTGKLRGYMREIELYRLEKKLERRAKGLPSAEGLPIERAYVEARNLAWLDPERGLARLQALVDLHKDRTDPTGPDGQCLDLARRQASRLRQQIAKSSVESLAGVEERLNRAESLRGSDPQTARLMWQSLVELYGDKPWAAEAVAKARQGLRDTERPPPAPPAQGTLPGGRKPVDGGKK